jgi:hypothetical protein
MTTAVPRRVKIFLLNHGQVKHLTSIFIPSPKTADVTKCTNSCTIALFPHANKILLRIIKEQPESYIGYETAMEQAGLRKRHRAREQITSVSESWTVQGSTTKMSNCFIDFKKDFESMQHLKMWNSIRCGNNQAFDSVNARPTHRVRSQVHVY